MAELVELRLEGRTAVLSFRREAKLNAISTDVEREVLAAFETAEVRTSRSVVLTGGGKAFSVGADLSEPRDESPVGIDAYYRETGALYERLARLPQPTFAAISGWCLGGGLELALACDFRIADETAVFGLPEVELGILPSSGGAHRLVRLIGPARAKELMLLRTRFDARAAREAGLVTEAVETGRALSRSLELADRIAELPPLAVTVIKEAADRMAESPRETSALLERLAYAALAQTDEARRASEAWAARRAST